jgi:branched-chain amino acid transport system substrate-binding protein
MPLQGASSPQTKAIVNGMKLALEQAGNRAGGHTIKYVSLDNSTAQAGSWTPEATAANARKAAQDKSTAVYLGEFNSGARRSRSRSSTRPASRRSARPTRPSA